VDADGSEHDAGRAASQPAAPSARHAAGIRTCPNCGAALADRSCKLVCPNPACGYFLSCSDYL
jgi:hypothetical protein